MNSRAATQTKSDIIPDVTIDRTFDAPRARVFRAWVTPSQVARWFGPKGFDNPVCELDVRPGGKINIHMRGPDGTIYRCGGRFHEIVEPELLVFTTTALDQAGNVLIEEFNTVTFTETGGKTIMRLHVHVAQAVGQGLEWIKGMEQGWSQSFDKLRDALPTLDA